MVRDLGNTPSNAIYFRLRISKNPPLDDIDVYKEVRGIHSAFSGKHLK